MDHERRDAGGGTADDPAGRIIDDKTAEARERIDRIEKFADQTLADAQQAAQEVEDRIPEREATEQRAEEPRAFEELLTDLKGASADLKQRIAEEKLRNDMPIDSALGDPEAERRNADGRNDLPDVDDE